MSHARHTLLVVGIAILALAGAPPGALAAAALVWAAAASYAPLRRLPWAMLAVLAAPLDLAWSLFGGTAGDLILPSLVPMAVFARQPDRTVTGVVGLMFLAAATRADPLAFAVASTVGIVLAASALANGVSAELGVRSYPPRWPLLVPLLAIPAFVLAPRASSDAAFTGFSTDVELGDVAVVQDDPRPVLALALDTRPSEPLYLRGAVFEQFDGRRWTTGRPAVPAAPPSGNDSEAITIVVSAEPVDHGVLFTTGRTVAIHPDGPVRVDASGTWSLEGPPRIARWTLLAAPPFGPGAHAAGRDPDVHDLELPPLDDRIVQLSRDWSLAGTHDGAIVDELVKNLRTFTYTKSPEDTDAADPLAEFLLARRTGHCEYFASSLAVLARLNGVPARVVTGFAGGEWDEPTHQLILRASDAHAWVEVWVDGHWTLADATPGPSIRLAEAPTAASEAEDAFRDWFIDFDRDEQRELLALAAQIAVPALLLTAAALAIAIGARRFRARDQRTRDPVAQELVATRAALVRAGWPIPANLPPVAAARWLAENAGDEAAPFERLAWLHYRVRYGGADPASLAGEAHDLAVALSTFPPPGPFALRTET